MRKKRHKKKSKASLFIKTLKVLPVLFAGMAVIYLGLFIKDIEFATVLPVTDVVVNGELDFVNKEEIKAIVKKTLVKKNISGGYFTVDLGSIREILLQKPWVKNVSLRREWPASLTVFIEEQLAVAYWNKDAYLSEDGEVFRPETIDTTLNLPNLNGPAGQHDNVWKFMNVLYEKTEMLNHEVVRLNLDDRRAWQLTLAERLASEQLGIEGAALENKSVETEIIKIRLIEVKLGRFDTTKRLQRLVSILPALVIEHGIVEYGIKQSDGVGKPSATGKIKVIDMRYPNGFAVQFVDCALKHFPDSSQPCKSSEV